VTTLSTATQVSLPQPTTHAHSGKGRMAQAIAQQEQSGALSSTDATALTSALGAIDSSLQGDSSANSGVSGTSGSSGSNRLDPSQMKDRIDSLISDQVSSGALTSDQASELKNLFSSHGTSVTSASAGGPDGPPPGPPSAGVGAASGTSDSAATSSSSSTSSASDLLTAFMQQLQAAQSSTSGYAASGTSATTTSSALLFDFRS